MKKVGLMLLALLWAVPLCAQSSLIGDVATERAKYGASMSPAQVAAMLNQIAWNHKAEGWGLLRKGSGNSCPLRDTFISCDILIHAPSIQHFDVLQDAENTARPQWNNVGPCVLSESSGCSMDKFLAPFDPGGPVVPPPLPPSTPPVDTSTLSAKLDTLQARVDVINLSLAAQLERIYADLAARDAAREAQLAAHDQRLKQHDENPSYFTKIFGNRYVQLTLAGLGTWIGQKVAQ